MPIATSPPRAAGRALAALVLAAGAALASCRGARPAGDAYAVTPSCELGTPAVAAGTPLAVTYQWTLDGSAARIPPGYRAFVHFVGPDGGIVFDDDHDPAPPPASWEAGRTYRYTRGVIVPPAALAGPLEVRVGLFAEANGRLALRGADRGLQEYAVGTLRVLARDARWRVVHGDGWYGAEAPPGDPFAEQRWIGRTAVASFRNRKRDVLVMVVGQTSAKAMPAEATLRVTIGGVGVEVPIASGKVEQWRVLFPAAGLGAGRWAELRLDASHTFVPRTAGLGDDPRELGFLVRGLHVGPADELSPLLREGALRAAPMAPKADPAQRAASPPAGRGP